MCFQSLMLWLTWPVQSQVRNLQQLGSVEASLSHTRCNLSLQKNAIRKFKPNMTITESTDSIQHQSRFQPGKKVSFSRSVQYASVTLRHVRIQKVFRWIQKLLRWIPHNFFPEVHLNVPLNHTSLRISLPEVDEGAIKF